MDQALRRKYYNLCNPDESLTPDDPRNVDIDVKQPDARGWNWVDELATRVELSDQPVCEFFTGLRGSGKSTELHRLAARLEDANGANLLAVVVDADLVLDITQAIDVSDVRIAILFGADKAVLEAEGANAQPLDEGRLKRFWTWLTTTEVGVKSVDVEADLAIAKAKGSFEFKTNATLREYARDKVKKGTTAFLETVDAELRAIEARAKGLGRAGIVVLFDSLEKLRGLSTNWNEVLSSAERIFSGGAPYLQLPVHVVYTFPPALVLRLGESVGFMPMIKLFDRAGQRCDPGFKAAIRLVEKRLPVEIQSEVFGPTNRTARVERLVQWSGGYPREIVRLLQRFVQQKTLDDDTFAKLLGMAGDVYRNTVPVDAYEWLAEVHVRGELAIREDPAHRELVDRMLQNNVVLRYQNKTRWFDVHPAVLEIRGVAEAVKKLKG